VQPQRPFIESSSIAEQLLIERCANSHARRDGSDNTRGNDSPGDEMLETLLESEAKPVRRAGGMVVSIATHTAAIVLAIVATARATSSPATIAPPPTHIVYRNSLPPRRHPTLDGRSSRSRDQFIPLVERALVPPIDVPDHLPPIDFTRPVTGEHDFDRGRTTLSGPLGGNSSDRLAEGDGIYTAPMVEKAVVPRPGNAAPLYPAALRSAQIEGAVTARFVVDTTGRAEPSSITIIETTHAAFAEAVRRSLLHARYLPATVGGRPVRQLVEQRFEFSLRR
jgi:TonB family protein